MAGSWPISLALRYSSDMESQEMKNNFYSLGPTYGKKWFWGHIITEIDPFVLAEKGMRGFKGAVRVKIVEGTVPGDFLWNGWILPIVSSKVLEVWEPFEKFETYRVLIEGNTSSVEYTGVAISGRAGPFDPKKSKAVFSTGVSKTTTDLPASAFDPEKWSRLVAKHPNAKPTPIITDMDGFYFDESKWDGSDFCTVNEFPCRGLVTDRVVNAMKKAKITNCNYEPIEEAKIGRYMKIPKF